MSEFEIADIRRIRLAPGEKLAIFVKERLSPDQIDRLRADIAECLPATDVIVFAGGIEIAAVAA